MRCCVRAASSLCPLQPPPPLGALGRAQPQERRRVRLNNSDISRSLSWAAAAEAGLSSGLGQGISPGSRKEQKLEKKGKSCAEYPHKGECWLCPCSC